MEENLFPEATFQEGSTAPLFASFFEGAEFFDSPQEAGGVYALGQEEQTNIILFGDVGGGNDVYADLTVITRADSTVLV